MHLAGRDNRCNPPATYRRLFPEGLQGELHRHKLSSQHMLLYTIVWCVSCLRPTSILSFLQEGLATSWVEGERWFVELITMPQTA